ncbi:MaoC/PaaZ C-terminal domain-containing protein [Rhodococcus artemisiae]|uniref:MaoC/PaaZ C-terminal domain-containing protein n=1 Tax=Rhodococcus artemisiae TaxID=714159 RepID=A0ABU7LKR9_9NOCA|nr:MaoC/PaaZ C-terminal domain-containing protein [Rhodococcus artemisiae]MEE2062165.1 MaoC/PaaZ C-terminal domain-containing protein [Rhodococcus artemisiae]
MTTNPASLAPRILEQPERWWEDLAVGDVVRGPGMTVTDAHLVTWAGLTGDIVSLHLDEEYAATTQFGQRIAHGPFTLSLALGLITQTGYFVNVVAWLGLDEVRALRPVLIGDTLRPEAELIEARPTKKEVQGIWTLTYRAVNQKGEVVMTFKSSFMVRRRNSTDA